VCQEGLQAVPEPPRRALPCAGRHTRQSHQPARVIRSLPHRANAAGNQGQQTRNFLWTHRYATCQAPGNASSKPHRLAYLSVFPDISNLFLVPRTSRARIRRGALSEASPHIERRRVRPRRSRNRPRAQGTTQTQAAILPDYPNQYGKTQEVHTCSLSIFFTQVYSRKILSAYFSESYCYGTIDAVYMARGSAGLLACDN